MRYEAGFYQHSSAIYTEHSPAHRLMQEQLQQRQEQLAQAAAQLAVSQEGEVTPDE